MLSVFSVVQKTKRSKINMDNKTKTKYTKIKHILMIVDIFFSLAILCFILFFRVSHFFRDYALSLSGNHYLAIFYYLICLGLFLFFLSFPLDFFAGFIIEHKFNLSTQNFAGWLKDHIKKLSFQYLFDSYSNDKRFFLFGLNFFIECKKLEKLKVR